MDWVSVGVVSGMLVGAGGFLKLGYYLGAKKNNTDKLPLPQIPVNGNSNKYVNRDVCAERHKGIDDKLSKVEKAVEPIPVIHDWVKRQQKREDAIRKVDNES